MLKEKDLSSNGSFNVMQGDSVSLDLIENDLRACANNYQIPVEFARDQIKSGGLLSGGSNECIVMYHPEHKRDYYNFVITIRRQGTVATVALYTGGQSKNFKNAALWENTRGGLVQSGIKALANIGAKEEQAREQDWYSYIKNIIKEVMG